MSHFTSPIRFAGLPELGRSLNVLGQNSPSHHMAGVLAPLAASVAMRLPVMHF